MPAETTAACVTCHGCGQEFASWTRLENMKVVPDDLGMHQTLGDGGRQQHACPGCRRRLLALNELEAIGGPEFQRVRRAGQNGANRG